MNYKDMSRRGLIRLNNDFDDDNNDALKNYLNSSKVAYEEIRPYEQIAERMDDVTEALQDRGDAVAANLIERANTIFDGLIAAISDEVVRCESVLDEQEDDNAYRDDGDMYEEGEDEEDQVV